MAIVVFELVCGRRDAASFDGGDIEGRRGRGGACAVAGGARRKAVALQVVVVGVMAARGQGRERGGRERGREGRRRNEGHGIKSGERRGEGDDGLRLEVVVGGNGRGTGSGSGGVWGARVRRDGSTGGKGGGNKRPAMHGGGESVSRDTCATCGGEFSKRFEEKGAGAESGASNRLLRSGPDGVLTLKVS